MPPDVAVTLAAACPTVRVKGRTNCTTLTWLAVPDTVLPAGFTGGKTILGNQAKPTPALERFAGMLPTGVPESCTFPLASYVVTSFAVALPALVS